MDFSAITSILGVILTIFGTSVAVFALDETRRAELVRFWKKWLTVVFVVVAVVNSALGLYVFFHGPSEIVRSDVVTLLIHLFNLLAIPGLWFVSAMLKAIDARDAKRVILAEKVSVMEARLESLSAARAEPAQET